MAIQDEAKEIRDDDRQTAERQRMRGQCPAVAVGQQASHALLRERDADRDDRGRADRHIYQHARSISGRAGFVMARPQARIMPDETDLKPTRGGCRNKAPDDQDYVMVIHLKI